MARIHLREGVRFLYDDRVYEIKKSHFGGLIEAEDIEYGISYTLEREKLTKALFDGRLRFELGASPAVAPSESKLRTDYRYSDFGCIPPEQRARAWRRFVVVREYAKVPPHERTLSAINGAIDNAMAILENEEDHGT